MCVPVNIVTVCTSMYSETSDKGHSLLTSIKDIIQKKLYIKDKFFCPKLQLSYTFSVFSTVSEKRTPPYLRTKIAGPKVSFILL